MTDVTAIVPSFLDDMDDLPTDLPSVQMEPGRLSWLHGETAGKIKAPGVFFGRDTAFVEPPSAPWELDERYLESDGPGYSVPVLRLAFIGERSQWFIPGEAKNDPITWIPNGQRSPDGTKVKKLIEYMVLIDGMADPMVLSVSGFYKSKPFEDLLRGYERGALAQLMRQKKRNFPRWAFWLTIGGKVDTAGKPILEKAKDASGEEFGSDVTPPTLLAAPALVDKATFMRAIDVWNLYNSLGWFKHQRLPRGVAEASYTISAVPQLPPGKNVPQQITEDELVL
jgi:hypothetical protein